MYKIEKSLRVTALIYFNGEIVSSSKSKCFFLKFQEKMEYLCYAFALCLPVSVFPESSVFAFS